MSNHHTHISPTVPFAFPADALDVAEAIALDYAPQIKPWSGDVTPATGTFDGIDFHVDLEGDPDGNITVVTMSLFGYPIGAGYFGPGPGPGSFYFD